MSFIHFIDAPKSKCFYCVSLLVFLHIVRFNTTFCSAALTVFEQLIPDILIA